MHSFKSVQDEGYNGIVKSIHQIDSIFQQLSVLKLVEMVSSREVSTMMSFFPPWMRKDWAEFHFKLSTQAQLHPCQSLHDFLADKLKLAKHMADIQPLMKPSRPAVSRSSLNMGTKSYMCCVHDGAGHKTGVCKVFKSMSISERKDKSMFQVLW